MNPVSLCVIGNSHVGAWKQAWNAIGPSMRDKCRITFFASGGTSIRDIEFTDGAIVAKNAAVRANFEATSGGLDRIVLADYSAFVLVGSDNFVRIVLQSYGSVGTAAHSAWVPVEHLVSEDCLHEAIVAQLKRLTKTFARIRSASQAPIFFIPRPFPGEQSLELEDFARFRGSIDTEYLANLVDAYKGAFNAVAAELGAEVLWQDDPTMRYPGFTKNEFVGSAPLLIKEGTRAENNFAHMNAAFGTLMLDKLLGRLEQRGFFHAPEAARSTPKRTSRPNGKQQGLNR